MKWPRSYRPSDFDDFVKTLVDDPDYGFATRPLTNDFEVVRLTRYDGTFLVYRTSKGKLSWHPELFDLYNKWRVE